MPSSENDVERSLLQKAIRRGNEELTEKVVQYLISVGDLGWLRRRLAVIAYEECWTVGNELRFDNNDYIITEQFKKLARTIKNKNAAGLASLAKNYEEGSHEILNGTSEEQARAITSIANAIKNQGNFWDWISGEPGYLKHKQRIDLAKDHISKAVFSTDKAQMLASAYFCVKDLVPDTKYAPPNNDPDFPYWIAFDKHTDIGKDIIEQASDKINLVSSRGMWLTFYFEGSFCGQLTDSPYWQYRINWGIERMNFSPISAMQKWNELKPIIIDLIGEKAEWLKDRVNKPIPKDDSQTSLF